MDVLQDIEESSDNFDTWTELENIAADFDSSAELEKLIKLADCADLKKLANWVEEEEC